MATATGPATFPGSRPGGGRCTHGALSGSGQIGLAFAGGGGKVFTTTFGRGGGDFLAGVSSTEESSEGGAEATLAMSSRGLFLGTGGLFQGMALTGVAFPGIAFTGTMFCGRSKRPGFPQHHSDSSRMYW